MTFYLKLYLSEQKKRVDSELSRYITKYCRSEKIRQPIWYAVEAGGKRIRPALCLAACAAIGGDQDKALPAACALEMIHTYSLIHDDLPALDNDDLRRGKPTCHVQFGEATAILAGDALLNMAFEVLSEAGVSSEKHAAHVWLQLIDIVSNASGCRGMIEGQVQDLAFEGVALNQAELENLHRYKTGALIKAAVHCGALLADADKDQIGNLLLFAGHIGLAFQVIDDILNVKGDPELLGKAVGTDSERKKNTYPALLGLEKSERYARSLIDDALSSIHTFDKKAEPLRAIARFINDRNY